MVCRHLLTIQATEIVQRKKKQNKQTNKTLPHKKGAISCSIQSSWELCKEQKIEVAKGGTRYFFKVVEIPSSIHFQTKGKKKKSLLRPETSNYKQELQSVFLIPQYEKKEEAPTPGATLADRIVLAQGKRHQIQEWQQLPEKHHHMMGITPE